MEENTKVTDAQVVNNDESTQTAGGWPWLAFVSGIIVALVGWQIYSVISNDAANTPEVVATVGNVEITRAQYEQSLQQTTAGAAAQGVDVTNAETVTLLQDQALEVLINTRVLVSAATTAGFDASDEEVDTQLTELETQYGGKEALEEQAASLGIDAEALRADIKEQLIVDKFLRENVELESINISAEEIREVYDGLVAAGQEMPDFATVSPAIEAQIAGQQQQERITSFVAELREQADIQVNL